MLAATDFKLVTAPCRMQRRIFWDEFSLFNYLILPFAPPGNNIALHVHSITCTFLDNHSHAVPVLTPVYPCAFPSPGKEAV